MKIADLFAKRTGPNAAVMLSGNSSVFNSIVERAVQCVHTSEEAHNKSVQKHKVVVETEDFNEAVKDKMKDNFKKAGEALETREAENKTKGRPQLLMPSQKWNQRSTKQRRQVMMLWWQRKVQSRPVAVLQMLQPCPKFLRRSYLSTDPC